MSTEKTRKLNKVKVAIALIILAVIMVFGLKYAKKIYRKMITVPDAEYSRTKEEPSVKVIDKVEDAEKTKTVTISAVGDCTLGWDTKFTDENRFDTYLKKNNEDYGYYFSKVKNVFEKDDLTIINLEGTFTSYTEKFKKTFNFSAPEEYKNILPLGNVDVVSFANNHTYDYGETGYNDTINALDSINMPYYSYERYLVENINGVKVGFFALLDVKCERYEDIDEALNTLKQQECDIIVASMHWGVEGEDKQCEAQEKMGHYLIDNGVDLVLGSHPHKIQGIEKYKDRYIVYSLGNFCFGGNTNPKDKDTMIFQQTFTLDENGLNLDDNINIIPAKISSSDDTNNYQPIVLEGEEKTRVMNRILENSKGIEYQK